MRYYTTEIKLATWSKSNSPFLSPVVHLPEFRPHPHFPHADQSLAAAAHDLPVVRPHRGHAHVMGVQRYHRGAGTQVKHSHPEQEGEKKKNVNRTQRRMRLDYRGDFQLITKTVQQVTPLFISKPSKCLCED